MRIKGTHLTGIAFFFLFTVIITVRNDGQKKIPIVMSTEKNFVRPTVVAMISLFENANPTTLYQVTILIPDNFKNESKINFEPLKNRYKNCVIEVTDMGEKFKWLETERFPPSAYYRLLIAGILGDEKKCIYLDGDVLVRDDLSEMYDMNMSKHYIAGVWSGPLKKDYERLIGIPDSKHYVCSGVLILNLESIRKDGIEKKFLNYLVTKSVDIKSLRIRCPDQDVLNFVCYGKILCLPVKFGFLINLMDANKAKDPVIIHFAGRGGKPWKSPSKTKFHEEFWYYAKKSVLYKEEIIKESLDYVSNRGEEYVKKEKKRRLRKQNKKTKIK